MKKVFDTKWGPDFIRSVPDCAGIYVFRNEQAVPIYVGKAKNLRRRLSQYRLALAKKSQRKMRMIVRKASTVEFELCTSETEALLLENQLIQKHRPMFNIAGAYAFLYPYLGFKMDPSSPRELVLCCTTRPEALEIHGFQLFGAFRSRETVGLAFDALAELLTYIGHDDPSQRAAFGKLAYTRISCFRQVDPEWGGLMTSFFRGESGEVMNRLFTCLLEKPGARRHAEQVQTHLRNLRSFFVSEASRLRVALNHHGRDVSMIPQEERDGIFLALT
ncbi:MAG TPA: GIY-YIG nuclease family protein [Oligoflexus sp.]|uniref:GIY-YIG nuclease family protein n=1 Tax=Oligoflexus sp. TaxID=1971216 RepID=UPI002D494E7D|nr:GIY-YIG nuclease family protein [Oligoflexus sp.]HYX34180.1 GIY-YIG nuclease family protein [Oligoflexus sp.]